MAYLRVWCFLALGAVSLVAQSREERWAQDIQFFANQFKTVHPKPYAKISVTDFDQAVTDLSSRVGQLADYEILLGMNRIAALVGDAHSWVYTFQAGSGMRQLPIRVRWFKDGFYVIAANASAVRALGRKVTAINGVPIDEVYAKVKAFIPAENNWWALQQAQSMLISPEVLHTARIVANNTDAVSFTFGDLTLALRVEGGSLAVFPRKARPQTPVSQRNPSLTYWFEYLPESRTLFFQYNQCVQDPALAAAEFGRQMAEFLAGQNPERVVIDLRNNTGGDSQILFEILEPLQTLLLTGRISPRTAYVLISRQTFSSGMMNAAQLKASDLVRLIGEPTGGSPNGPGEVKGFTLPNSRWNGQVSSKEFSLEGYAGRDTVEPDLLMEMTIDDWANERDPLLEFVIRN